MGKKEIRRTVSGRPAVWESSINLGPTECAYLKEPSGNLSVLQEIQESHMQIFGMASESKANKSRDKRELGKAKKMRERKVSTDPDLVIYSGVEEAYYEFSHFLGMDAVFKFLKKS